MALEKAKLVSESRILTDSDFRAIRVAQARRQMSAERRGGAQKRPLTNDEARLDDEIQEKIARWVICFCPVLTCPMKSQQKTGRPLVGWRLDSKFSSPNFGFDHSTNVQSRFPN